MTEEQSTADPEANAAAPAAPSGLWQKVKRVGRAILLRDALMVAVGALLGSVSPLVARWHFLLELGTHFMALYVIFAAAALALLVYLRAWRSSVVALAALVLAGAQVAPCYWAPATATAKSGNQLRVMEANVLTSNRNHDAFLNQVRREQPDVIAVQEIGWQWVEALRELEDLYPHAVLEPQEDNFGIGLLSKLPLKNSEVLDLEGVPAIHAEVLCEGNAIHVFVVHTLPPVRPWNASARNRQLERLSEIVKSIDGPAIVLGDLNATMWSPYFKSLCREAGLEDARRGRGILATWPVNHAPLMIPIDHGLYSVTLGLVSLRRGKRFGSDHLPLVFDFIVPQAKENPAAPATAA